jgi:transcriptional regulator with XRE-family HTH domain
MASKKAPTKTTPRPEGKDLSPVVAENLRTLRAARGLSLEKLAIASGVSRAMLGQVELGKSTPTINVLWKIARALDVTFSSLIQAHATVGTVVVREKGAKILTSSDGSFRSRALFPFDGPRRSELYELKLAPRSSEQAEAHAPGTTENLVVTRGALRVHVPDGVHELGTGDAVLFFADVPHSYENPHGEEAVMILAMNYRDVQS